MKIYVTALGSVIYIYEGARAPPPQCVGRDGAAAVHGIKGGIDRPCAPMNIMNTISNKAIASNEKTFLTLLVHRSPQLVHRKAHDVVIIWDECGRGLGRIWEGSAWCFSIGVWEGSGILGRVWEGSGILGRIWRGVCYSRKDLERDLVTRSVLSRCTLQFLKLPCSARNGHRKFPSIDLCSTCIFADPIISD